MAKLRKARKPSSLQRVIDAAKRQDGTEYLEGDSLCSDCLKLNIPRHLNRCEEKGLKDEWGYTIGRLGKRYRTSSPSACPLCNLLQSSRVRDQRKAPGRDKLRVLSFPLYSGLVREARAENRNPARRLQAGSRASTVERIERGPPTIQMPRKRRLPMRSKGPATVPLCLGVTSDDSYPKYATFFKDSARGGVAVCTTSKRGSRDWLRVEEVSPRFNVDKTDQWLDYCLENHTDLCPQREVHIGDIKLIHCESRTISAPTRYVPYVALSYVWAKRTKHDRQDQDQSDAASIEYLLKTPRVVSDAIKVTQSLGYDYLWVDKYCIDQENPLEKHEQMMNMDSIYENAVLTIIAAAGDDEHSGLPGVNRTARKPQRKARIGDLRILSTLTDPQISISRSTWSTRGWTFQEAILSTRRLIFTPEQCYFECNAMNCCESVSVPLDQMHTEDKKQALPGYRAGMFGLRRDLRRRGATNLPMVKFGHLDIKRMNTATLMSLYASYVEGYSKRALSYEEDSLNAFAGILRRFEKLDRPVYHIWGVPMTGRSKNDAQIWLLHGLAWSHYGSEAGPQRRAHFPSWTWAGWTGEIDYESLHVVKRGIYDTAEVSFERDGRNTRQTINEAEEPRVLILRTLKIPTKVILKLDPTLIDVRSSTGPYISFELVKEMAEEPDRYHFACLFWRKSYCTSLMLKRDGDKYVRVGLVGIYELRRRWPRKRETLYDFKIV